VYGLFGGNDDTTVQVVQILATLAPVFIWSVSLWFLAVSVVSCLAVWRTLRGRFRLNWWAFVFPNVGFVLATINIGKMLKSEPVLGVCSVVAVCLVVVYAFVLVCHVRAVWRCDILVSGKDEDVYIRNGWARWRLEARTSNVVNVIPRANEDGV
jgi:tellurite resistance protein TehA-like permease